MAEDRIQTPVVKREKSRFPEHLDFQFLRQKGIEYLGALSGNLWTDHNVHDPGITILESLVYALLDLGYASKHSFEDLIAQRPKNNSEEEDTLSSLIRDQRNERESCFIPEAKLPAPDSNFFKAAEILGNSPLTILDYRKLLIDQPGIRNAWLEIDGMEEDLCRDQLNKCCPQYLNGLYHVYIDLDNSQGNANYKSLKWQANFAKSMRDLLMSHRNFCEDFVDVTILCKKEIGFCAEIELGNTADLEVVFNKIIKSLGDFITPTPRHYSLAELLEKKRTLEEIFEGRPIDLKQSHGFLDVKELQELRLKKEIRRSDIYEIILGVEGVESVKKLTFRECDGNITDSWTFNIPTDHIAEFKLACSGFRFFKQGVPLTYDIGEFIDTFQLTAPGASMLHKADSDYLNPKISAGSYKPDLASYYSIQHEFPKVFGIQEGGLAPDVSPRRKAQAYQLKAYLLFFDQLLANYLSQLSNIRSLFALRGDAKVLKTYFTNDLNSVPDLPELLRFRPDETSKSKHTDLGTNLVFPTDRGQFEKWLEEGRLEQLQPNQFPAFEFCSGTKRDMAVQTLINDLHYLDIEPQFIETDRACHYYFLNGTSQEVIYISFDLFSTAQEARQHAENIKFVGTFEENYRSFQAADGGYSFMMEYQLSTYPKYLELISEDQDLFYRRRHEFLDHLLSRFAEKFTDYSLLSYRTLSKDQITKKSQGFKERFLENYPEISANRGKAYDYYANHWSNDNISGFEHRFKALAGISDLRKHHLCHFEVDQYEKNYILKLHIGSTIVIVSKTVFSSSKEALSYARQLFQSLSDKQNYEVIFDSLKLGYRIQVCFSESLYAELEEDQPDEKTAWTYIDHLHRLFSVLPQEGDTVVSRKEYRVRLANIDGSALREYHQTFTDEKLALSTSKKEVNVANNPKIWKPHKGYKVKTGRLVTGKRTTGQISFMDVDQFKIIVSDDIVGRPGAFTYGLLDLNNSYRLDSTAEFTNRGQAKLGCYRLLFHLADLSKYSLETDKEGDLWVTIYDGKGIAARSSTSFENEEAAIAYQKAIRQSVLPHCYDLLVVEKPTHWKFRYTLSDGKQHAYDFRSVQDFQSVKKALIEGSRFAKTIDKAQVAIKGKAVVLTSIGKAVPAWCRLHGYEYAGSKELLEIKERASIYFAERQQVLKYYKARGNKPFEDLIDEDDISKRGTYVYRLVDKDHIVARSSQRFEFEAEARDFRKRLFKKTVEGFNFLKICLGGDVVVKREDKKRKKNLYYYQIKSTDNYYKQGKDKGKPIVLFEGTHGYESKEKAETAFLKHYLQIFYLGRKREHYGKNKEIELVRTHYSDDPCEQGTALAFVPKETLDELGGYEESAIRAIMRLVQSYPIQYKGPEDFMIRLIDAPSGEVIWRGSRHYSSAKEARETLEFLKVLLKYTGNYVILKGDDCHYRIYLREVLAESVERYLKRQQAWEGLEKFINVAQTNNSVHSIVDGKSFCYSHFYACQGDFLHPCTYQSERERDKVLVRLYKAARVFNPINLFRIDAGGGSYFLRNLQDQRIARLTIIPGKEPKAYCETLFILVEAALNHSRYRNCTDGIWLVNDKDEKILEPVDQDISMECWKEQLIAWAYYFPLRREKENEHYTYSVEIRLPGFNDFAQALRSQTSCVCKEEEETPKDTCHLAWRGRCPYSSCEAAFDHFLVAMYLLGNRDNYRPYFECECGPFGIAIIPESAILAKNPQCYPDPKTACDAVKRAKDKLNDEGLHVVEHLLLRPRCREDCSCRAYKERCENKTGCEFKWQVESEDPCEEDRLECFIPGQDPYSFIATAVLPAWPERFRSKEKRELVERLLRQEAPAHVLMHVLWLAPQDFCEFETTFKKWNKYLAKKPLCDQKERINCELLNMITNRKFSCMDDTPPCKPCEEEGIIPDLCAEEIHEVLQGGQYVRSSRVRPRDFANQINELFCWQIQDCLPPQMSDTNFWAQEYGIEDASSFLMGIIPDMKGSIKKSDDSLRTIDSPVKSPSRKTTTTGNSVKNDRAALIRFYNSRRAKRTKEIELLLTTVEQNVAAIKTQRFVQKQLPKQEDLSQLIEQILLNKKSGTKSKALSKAHIHKLIEKSISFYLDKMCFEGRPLKRTTGWNGILRKFKEKGISTQRIYREWDERAIEKAHGTVNLERFRKWLALD